MAKLIGLFPYHGLEIGDSLGIKHRVQRLPPELVDIMVDGREAVVGMAKDGREIGIPIAARMEGVQLLMKIGVILLEFRERDTDDWS